MNVRFGENYWGSRGGGSSGEKIIIEKHFTWAGRDFRIPAVYVCEEGIVVDFCVRIPVKEIRSFLDKWKPILGEGMSSENLTEEEQEAAERENPFRMEFRGQAVIGGKEAPSSMGCGTSWYPPDLHDQEHPEALSGVEEELMDAYGCDRNVGWKFWRTSFGWPEGVRSLESLEITFRKCPVCYPGIHFKTGANIEERTVDFIHPETGVKHVLTVHGWEQRVLPEHVTESLPSERLKRIKSPREYVMLQYSVEPDILQGELQIQDCAPSDPPVLEKKGAAGNVSIIGKADGPTSVFIAGKSRGHRPGERSAVSSLHYEAVDEVEWRMSFYVKDEQEMRVRILEY